jgi:TldD protein
LQELTDRALNAAQIQGATYADIHIVRRQTQSITVKNGVVEALEISEDQGFGVRVIVDGAWGFASSARLEQAEMDRVTSRSPVPARWSSGMT